MGLRSRIFFTWADIFAEVIAEDKKRARESFLEEESELLRNINSKNNNDKKIKEG